MSIAKKLFGFVDHANDICDASSGKRVAYSIIHIFIIVLTMASVYYTYFLFNNRGDIKNILLMIVLVPLSIGFLIESVMMILYQAILFIVNLREFEEDKGYVITNIILSIIFFGLVTYSIIQGINIYNSIF